VRPRRQHRHSHRHDHGGHGQSGDHTPTAVVAIELSPQATAGAAASAADAADLPGSPAPRRHAHHHHHHHDDGACSDDGHDAVAVQPLVVPTPGSSASGPLSPRLAMRPAGAGPVMGGAPVADALDAAAGVADAAAAAARRRGAPSGSLRAASDGCDDHGRSTHDDDDDEDHAHAHEHARLSWPEVGTLVAGVLLPLLINLNHGH